MAHLEQQAKDIKDREDLVPFTGEKRGMVIHCTMVKQDGWEACRACTAGLSPLPAALPSSTAACAPSLHLEFLLVQRSSTAPLRCDDPHGFLLIFFMS